MGNRSHKLDLPYLVFLSFGAFFSFLESGSLMHINCASGFWDQGCFSVALLFETGGGKVGTREQ